jgi:hypothetical protein
VTRRVARNAQERGPIVADVTPTRPEAALAAALDVKALSEALSKARYRPRAFLGETYAEALARHYAALAAVVPTASPDPTALDPELRAAAKELLRFCPVEVSGTGTSGPFVRAADRLRAAIGIGNAAPDHRVCTCGHTGSVHNPAPGALLTELGYAIEGVGGCRGTAESGRYCPCVAFALRETKP